MLFHKKQVWDALGFKKYSGAVNGTAPCFGAVLVLLAMATNTVNDIKFGTSIMMQLWNVFLVVVASKFST